MFVHILKKKKEEKRKIKHTLKFKSHPYRRDLGVCKKKSKKMKVISSLIFITRDTLIQHLVI